MIVFFTMFNSEVLYAQASEPDSYSPAIKLTDFVVLNQSLPVDSILELKEIALSDHQNTFSLSFKAIGLPQGDTIYYQYKLEGLESAWRKTTEAPTIHYTSLQPGRYTFLVKAYTKNANLSTPITEWPIVIRLPFWLKWWFILGCFLLFVGTLYYLHRLSMNRLLAVEALRQKVARDLHDDMGSALSTINILSLMAMDKLGNDPVKTHEFLKKISDNSSRMLEAMDDIVWSINPENDSMEKTFARMRSFAAEVLDAKDIDLAFTVVGAVTDMQLNMEKRRDLFLIYKEAVNNIAKYAHCKKVTIKLAATQQLLKLEIADNGVGFDVKKADNGNGLTNMQKRAENLGGTFQIISEPAKGTTIHLHIKIT